MAQMRDMPLYYFNLYNDDVTLADEAVEFDDDEAATAHAITEVRALAADSVRHGNLVGAHYIEIRNEGQDIVGRVRFDEAVNIS